MSLGAPGEGYKKQKTDERQNWIEIVDFHQKWASNVGNTKESNLLPAIFYQQYATRAS